MRTRRTEMPELDATGRRYLDSTQRARLQNPGIERYVAGPKGVGRWLGPVVVLALLALGAAAWIANR